MIFEWPPCWSLDGLLGVILVLGEPVTEWAGWDGWAWSSTGRGRTLNSLSIEKCVLPPQLISGFLRHPSYAYEKIAGLGPHQGTAFRRQKAETTFYKGFGTKLSTGVSTQCPRIPSSGHSCARFQILSPPQKPQKPLRSSLKAPNESYWAPPTDYSPPQTAKNLGKAVGY